MLPSICEFDVPLAPGEHRLMHYDIEADGMLLPTCNSRCPYCFIDPKLLGAKIQRHGTPEQW